MVNAGATSIASRAAVSFVDNTGDMGAMLRELGSDESISSIATAMASAGAVSAPGNSVTMEVRASR